MNLRRFGPWGGCAVALLLSPLPAAEAGGGKKAAAHRRVTDETAEDYVGPTLPRARVLFRDARGVERGVDVEVAATPRSRSRGLMWRESLPEGQGMLFVFADEEVQTFWMRHTLISLDMVFIDSRGDVVGIVENTEPRSLVRRSARVPSLYVLEVPGGWSRAAGLERGASVRFEGLEGLTVLP